MIDLNEAIKNMENKYGRKLTEDELTAAKSFYTLFNLATKNTEQKCYRDGGCGPYESLSCNECPASKPSYVER